MIRIFLFFIIASAISCTGKQKPIKHGSRKADTTRAVGIVALNVYQNDYRCLTLQRITKDTFIDEIIDTTGARILSEKVLSRDTSYLVWWPLTIPDSTGKPRKTVLGQDSVRWQWIPLADNKMVLQSWDIKLR